MPTLGAESSHTGSRSQTKYNREISVTRAHHPLAGKIFEVIQPAGIAVTIILPDGSRIKIPRQWTDIDGVTPRLTLNSVFTADSVKELLDLVDLILKR